MSPLWATDDFELSYLLVRSANGAVLAAQEEGKLRTPASAMKVVTAAAALEQLGPEHRYRTTVGITTKLDKTRVYGDLYLQGEADPELTRDALAELAGQLHALGLRRVIGDLVVDEGPFATPVYGSGWAWDDTGSPYSPEITGLAVDGGVVVVGSEEPLRGVEVVAGEESSLHLIPGRAGILIRGTMPQRLAPPYSALRTGELFRRQLQQRGIIVTGAVRLGKAEGTELAVHASRPLKEILQRALWVSDNLAMELIARSSAAGLPQSLQEAALRRADGSGLSRYNLLSARQLTTVLLASPELKALLPGPGEGTLRHRFSDLAVAGQLKAKTGTLGNISALTGYLYPGQPQECVFAILINGHLGSGSERKAIEDALVMRWFEQFFESSGAAASSKRATELRREETSD